MCRKTGKRLAAALLALIAGTSLAAQTLTARLESASIWLGQSTRLTLVLEGSDQQIAPDLSIPGITVTPLGGSPQNSQTITTVNGKTTRQVSYSYIFAYELKPERPGTFTIPAFSLDIAGRSLTTAPLQFTVKEPQKSPEYHFLLKADRTRSYPGQDITLTVTFLFSKNIRSLYFDIPGLKNLDVYPVSPKSGSGNGAYQLEINGTSVPFARVDTRYQGKDYAGVKGTLKIHKTSPGRAVLSGSTAVFEGSVGTQRVRDFFGRISEQDVYDTIVVPADPLTLSVQDYPETGRPEGFFGLAGDIRLEVTAQPRQVRVGDPVTLELTFYNVNDPYVPFPPLREYLGTDFKIPPDRSPDKIEGTTKTVTQTIRAVSREVTEVPALRIPYFNTASETYGFLEAPALPLSVEASQTVGIADLEGSTDTGKISTEKLKEGIYFNYGGPALLQNAVPAVPRILKSLWFWLFLLVPPGAALALFVYYRLYPQLLARQLEKRSTRQEFRALEKRIRKGKTAAPDAEALVNEFLQTRFGITHYSQLAQIFHMNPEEKALFEHVIEHRYRGGTPEGSGSVCGPEHLLSIIGERL